MYAVQSSSRLEHNHSQYSPHPPDPYSLAGPATPSSSVRNSYRTNSHDYYSYSQSESPHPKIPYSNSRNYSPTSVSSASEFSSPLSAYPDPQYLYSNIASEHENHSTYPGQNYTTDVAQELPSVLPSLSRRRDSSSLGINVPLSSSKPSAHTPSTVSTSDSWSPVVKEVQPIDLPKKKPRREKPKIALAPDQPPTTQGKPRARVYVACLQCRTRKIRCDGAKPVCHNCGRRNGGGSDCNYDSVPRRRGPDKTPGARQRMARELRQEMEAAGGVRRRRRRPELSAEVPRAVAQSNQYDHIPRSEDAGLPLNGSLSPASSNDYSISPSYTAPSASLPSPLEDVSLYSCSCHGLMQCPNNQPYVSARTQTASSFGQLEFSDLEQSGDVVPLGGAVPRGHISSVDDDSSESDEVTDISNEPSIRFSRKIWYETLLSIYASFDSRSTNTLTRTDREAISRTISTDLRFLFRVSNYWFSFFHVPSFFGNFFDPVKRENMQPSLILAALALSTFWRSSELGEGRAGRIRALRLREEAQSALEASFNAGSIDETLAQAAWILALFEVCAHPEHSTSRSVSAIVMLDSVIRCLALTVVDADDPHTSVFVPGQVPKIASPSSSYQWSSTTSPASYSSPPDHGYHSQASSTSSGCSCLALTLGKHWSSSLEHTPLWATTPRWDPSWSEAEIRKESSRRLVWAAISLAAGHVSYASANESHIPGLFIANPANFALLFSGESIYRSPSLSPSAAKDTIWALYDRSFLLWHTCARVRAETSMNDVEKGEFAVKAWLEADAIENALNKHTCAIEKAYVFQGREYLFNTRMYISFEFQRHIPLVNSDVSGIFHRNKAEEWLTHQMAVAERYMHGLHTITGNSNNHLARRPFFVFWFSSQILRALRLWQCDNSLTIALDVCKAFLPAVDYLSALWPCQEQRQRYLRIRDRLDAACYAAGIPSPPPPNFSLPELSSNVL
ncbi:hypothetical protein GYMLUDRAFT_75693 [Collybiopsis luxurians FD-317 M1]|uniref:Zn(2)-C6 fungal-type domain-containing protein n=1 Tax=Collybiopsis luxurians FD-317 M1 TaxID=944289 RepID=A0A0D0B1W5_9AGAR|nr:hypothetical protein GYMLUDRAFT_75693 [Collybiopsis luxurians FD-317 M1]